MPQAVDEIDLEEGEIIDSCGEDNFGENEKVNNSHACDELEVADKKKKKKRKKRKKDDDDQNEQEKPKKKRIKYIDHDRVNEEDDWYPINPLPYPKKNFNKIINDGNIPLQLNSFDDDYYSPDCKSSSQDEDEPNEELEQQNRKMGWKNSIKRQNNERILKKKRKDGLLRGTQDSKKRRMMLNKNKRKVIKPKLRAPLCKFFLEGRCSKGSECQFSHATQPSAKMELCKFYLNGYCAKGESCLYMHEEFPCKFYHTGAKCYSEPNCLFSHAPLTEETRRILDKYLESSKGEEEKEKDENTIDTSPQKQQQKRPSLLGSPPRHVKEAAETLQWRQYVSQMQHPRRFDRYNNPRNPLMLSPPPLFPRPNFYIDTLPRSPSKIPSLMSMPPINMPPLNPNLPIPPLLKMPGLYSQILESENSSQDERENNAEYRQRNGIKNDKFSNTPNNATDIAVKQSTTSVEPIQNTSEEKDQHETKDPDKANNAESSLVKEKETKIENSSSADITSLSPEQINNQQTANSPPTDMSMLPLPPPLVIPTHLPRRQRELYLRIQQHQKEADSGTDVSEDPESKAEEEKSENWYSSDEDDTEDQPLTAVLKKLQQTPLPNIAQQRAMTSSNSTIDIAKMLTEIRQQTTQKSACNGSNTTHQQKDFWQSLLSGAAPTVKDPRSNSSADHLQAQNKSENRDPRIRSNSSSVDPIINTLPPSRDPRLHRDPRLANRDPRITSANGPVNNPVVEGLAIQLPPVTPLWDSHSAVIKTNPVVIEKTKVAPGNVPVPYKLRSITVSQPNYSSYVFACQSNPKLLNDPRLKKYFKQMSGLLRQQQHLTEDSKTITSIRDSKNQLEGQAKPSVENDNQEEPASADVWDRLQKPKTADPRTLKIPLNVVRPTGSTTPPLPATTSAVTIVNPTSTTNTVVASHLPKSVTDPRLTRLLHQPDHRRALSSCDQNQSISVNKPLPLQRKLSVGTIRSVPSSITPPLLKQPLVKESQLCSSGNDSPKLEQLTIDESSSECPTAEKEKKKKLTSYNRKSSMDYASPLSSYEDNSNSSSYSSYNRRPQAPQTAVTSSVVQPNIPQPPKSVSPVDIRHTLQESSGHNQISLSFLTNETSAEAVVASEHIPSLKEVFKTIDPTASPFCSI